MPEVLRPYVASQAGQWFDLRKMDETRDDMRDALGNMGYAFANVRVEQENDPATGAKNLTYVIEEGQKVFVERIDIRGNDSTQDYVIVVNSDLRKAMPIQPASFADLNNAFSRWGILKALILRQGREAPPIA